MTTELESAIFEGQIRHRRFLPVKREFEYRIFMVYLDLDELDEVLRIHPLWSTRRRAPARFKREDYLGPVGSPLKQAVQELVAERTGREVSGPIRMLTHLRYWGVCFNPVTFYYCFDGSGQRVETVLAEVTNTPWGDRYVYVVEERRGHGVMSTRVAKQLHVSPLMDMDHSYELIFAEPGRTLSVHMESRKESDLYFDATLGMERRELSRGLLGRLLLGRVPMPVKVLGGIHWEAAKTWLSGVRFHPRPGQDGVCPVSTETPRTEGQAGAVRH